VSVAKSLSVALLLAAMAAGRAEAVSGELQAPAFDAAGAFRESQAAIGRPLRDALLTASDGSRIAISGLRGRPLVISPVYTSCFHVCPTTTSWLARVAGIAASVLGEDAFTVLTVGFDTANDTPERMREYARERGIASPQWIFASADAAAMARLLEDIGFRRARSGAGFDHMVQATIVDPEGRVYLQVYGQQFEPPLLVDGLKRLVTGQRAAEATLPGWLESVRLVCTVFDPKSGRYRFDWSLVLSIAIGAACFSAVAVFVWRSWRDLPPPGRPAA
jgi:protein SCO1/2